MGVPGRRAERGVRAGLIAATASLIALGAGAALAIAAARSDPPGGEPTVQPRLASYPPLGKCSVFPKPPAGTLATAPSLGTQAAWNQNVSQAPVDPDSSQIINYINAHGDSALHPDFGSPRSYGIPYAVVGKKAAKTKVRFTAYGDESSRRGYRIPYKAPVEGGKRADGDRHVLSFDRRRCKLYELYRAFPKPRKKRWLAESGVVWDLRSAARWHESWTSADAAGLPVFPGLTRYDEVARGRINHALRVTFDSTRNAWLHPAVHCAGDTANPLAPPMGMRLRLSAGFDISAFTGQARVIAIALKRYGFIVADNGSNWFFSGTSDRRWNDDNLNQLKDIPGSAFQVISSQDPVHVC